MGAREWWDDPKHRCDTFSSGEHGRWWLARNCGRCWKSGRLKEDEPDGTRREHCAIFRAIEWSRGLGSIPLRIARRLDPKAVPEAEGEFSYPDDCPERQAERPAHLARPRRKRRLGTSEQPRLFELMEEI